MEFQTITDPSDPRVAAFSGLRKDDRKHLARGTFVVEGRRCVQRLIESRYTVHSILVESGREAETVSWLSEPVAVFSMTREVMQAIAGYPFHRGFLALAKRPVFPAVQEWIADRPRFRVALASLGVSQRENLGSIIRTSTGLGLGPLLLTDQCADPFTRMAIRASMGTVFKQVLIRMTDPISDLRSCLSAGIRVVAATTHGASTALSDYRPDGRPQILLIGHESTGIPEKVEALATDRICIPMARGVDSLNAAVAAALLMYGMSRNQSS